MEQDGRDPGEFDEVGATRGNQVEAVGEDEENSGRIMGAERPCGCRPLDDAHSRPGRAGAAVRKRTSPVPALRHLDDGERVWTGRRTQLDEQPPGECPSEDRWSHDTDTSRSVDADRDVGDTGCQLFHPGGVPSRRPVDADAARLLAVADDHHGPAVGRSTPAAETRCAGLHVRGIEHEACSPACRPP